MSPPSPPTQLSDTIIYLPTIYPGDSVFDMAWRAGAPHPDGKAPVHTNGNGLAAAHANGNGVAVHADGKA